MIKELTRMGCKSYRSSLRMRTITMEVYTV
jgi:hypothetical protein